MKVLAAKWRKTLATFLSLALLMGCVCAAPAQALDRSALLARLDQIAQELQSIQAKRDLRLRESKALTDKINATKQKLGEGSHALLERQLQGDLQRSRALADRIQTLDREVHALTEQSVGLKRQLVELLANEIDELSRRANATKDATQKRRHLERVFALEKQRDAYQAQIAQESNELLLGLEIVLDETDGPDEIQQKLAILNDQRDIIRAKIRQIDAQIRETQKTLGLRENMLELLRDLRRGEEDEFDLDRSLRIAEVQEELADIETRLEIMVAKKESWRMKEREIDEKIKQFSQEVEKFRLSLPKGEPGDGR